MPVDVKRKQPVKPTIESIKVTSMVQPRCPDFGLTVRLDRGGDAVFMPACGGSYSVRAAEVREFANALLEMVGAEG